MGIGLICVAAVLLLVLGKTYRILGWFLLAYVILFPFLVALSVLSQLNANPAFTSKTTLSFSESGITTAVNRIRSERAWESFHSWSHSDKYFFLNADALGTAITMPKRAFTDTQLLLFFDQLSHINGKLVSSTDEI